MATSKLRISVPISPEIALAIEVEAKNWCFTIDILRVHNRTTFTSTKQSLWNAK